VTDRKDALIELLAKVKADWAPADDEVVLGVWHSAFGHNWIAVKAYEAYNGSLDAAKALHEAVLPELGWEVMRTSKYPGMVPGSSRFEFRADVGWGTTWVGRAADPARAWLIAILQALISEAQPAPPPTQEGLDL
jgi:hypothetical protein